MGTFRIEIQTVGGHGCQREVKDGGTVVGCGQDGCPDCMARSFVKSLAEKGMMSVYSDPTAKLIHWPGTPGQVTDDLLTGIRSGSF